MLSDDRGIHGWAFGEGDALRASDLIEITGDATQ